MKHIVKCKYCGKQFDAETVPYVKVSNGRRYAHKTCAVEYQKNNPQQYQEDNDKNNFYAYLKFLFGSNYDYVRTKRLAEKYIKDYKYTYTGMTKSLIWFYEIQQHSIENSNYSIGIIPYIYEDSKRYYYNLYLAQQINNDKKIENYKLNNKVIEICPPKKEKKYYNFFNLEDDIGEGEEGIIN